MRGHKTAFIGTGFMARAMIGGIVDSGVRSPSDIFTVNPVDRNSAVEVSSLYGVRMGEIGDLSGADIVVWAIKPQQFDEAVAMYREFLAPDKLYLSIMAGITTKRLEDAIPGAAVVRLMPNLALSVRKSSTAYAPGKLATEDDCALVEELFSVLGTVLRVSEDMISSVTALSGSGPAYFCLLAEKLAEAAKAEGMDSATAHRNGEAPVGRRRDAGRAETARHVQKRNDGSGRQRDARGRLFGGRRRRFQRGADKERRALRTPNRMICGQKIQTFQKI